MKKLAHIGLLVFLCTGCTISSQPDIPQLPTKHVVEEKKISLKKVAEKKTLAMYEMNAQFRFSPLDTKSETKVALLTFDDGPKEKEMLVQILDTLEHHQAKAIFFVNGYRAKKNPDLLQLITARGQTIGNHSWDHINLSKLSKAKMQEQVQKVQALVKELTGQEPRFFRPPFGTGNQALRDFVKEQNMLYMNWSNGSLDWDPKEKINLIDHVIKQLHPGCNILMHELPWTAEALDDLLKQIKDSGYSFLDPAQITLPMVCTSPKNETCHQTKKQKK